MRILHINDAYRVVGGTETNTLRQITLSRKQGLDVYYFAFEMNPPTKTDSKTFVYKESRMGLIRNIGRFLFNFKAYFALRKYIGKVKPDIIHLHNINNKYPLTVLAAIAGVRTVQTAHDNGHVCITGWCLYKDSFKNCDGLYGLKCASHKCIPWYYLLVFWPVFKIRDNIIKKRKMLIICPSRRLMKLLTYNGFQKLEYLQHFLAKNEILRIKKSKREGILYMGRLSREKGSFVLLEAIKKAVRVNSSINLKIIGEGSSEKEMKLYVKKEGLQKNITFLGKINGNERYKHLASAKFLVLPSIWNEQFGITGIEGLSLGIPSIASKVGGISEWCVDGKTGLLVKPGNSSELADKIVKLIKDDAEIERLGKNGKNLVREKFSEQAHFTQLINIYREEISG